MRRIAQKSLNCRTEKPIPIAFHISKFVRAVAGVTAAGLLVAGCGAFDKEQLDPCPAVFILDDAQAMTKFKPGPGRDITDILFEAQIVNFRGKCEYDEDDGRYEVEILLNVQIAVQRGTANRDRKINFEYFAAIPSFESKAEGKSIFEVAGEFDGTRTRLMYQDELTMNIPVDQPSDGAKLEIVLGLQLTPEELKYNRSRRQQ